MKSGIFTLNDWYSNSNGHSGNFMETLGSIYDSWQETHKGLKVLVYNEYQHTCHPLPGEQMTTSSLKTQTILVRTFLLDQKQVYMDCLIQSCNISISKFVSFGFPAEGRNNGRNLLWFYCQVSTDLICSFKTKAILGLNN